MRKTKDLNRVAIIGCGHVAAASVYSLLLNGTVKELVLIDKGNDRLLGQVMDLRRSVPMASSVIVRVGDYEDAGAADIVVIAAGAGARAGETPLDLLDRNTALVRKIMRKLKAVDFGGIVLMTSNPADVLAQVAQEESNLPAQKVIGSGNVFETESMMAEKAGRGAGRSAVAAQAMEKREDSEIATWCAARIGGAPLVDFCTPNCPDFDQMLEQVRRRRTTAPQIIKRRGQTPFPVGSCVTKICEAILRDEHAVLPVSTMITGQYGVSGVYLSLPCVIGAAGVERIIEFPLNQAEQQGLREKAAVLGETLGRLRKKPLRPMQMTPERR